MLHYIPTDEVAQQERLPVMHVDLVHPLPGQLELSHSFVMQLHTSTQAHTHTLAHALLLARFQADFLRSIFIALNDESCQVRALTIQLVRKC
eukprot:1160269-Pelagomonas_calceolata.AAC.18